MSLRVFADDAPVPAKELAEGVAIELDEDESRYLARVRRARVEDEVEVFTGAARWRARIVELPPKRGPARLELLGEVALPRRGPARHLLLGLPDRPAALEAIGAATALDVAEIVMVRCVRTPHGPPNPARIESVIRATRRQSGRVDVPAVREVGSLAEALESLGGLPVVYGASEVLSGTGVTALGSRPLDEVRRAALALAVGPEGGFAPEELTLLRTAEAHPMTLGTWILRTELAVAAGLGHLSPPGGG